ncbi:MAG TPA: pilin [Candidatus Saccharimonadales bacterium]|nr:pilin [Candidatus Saccharimonadales bacterium]
MLNKIKILITGVTAAALLALGALPVVAVGQAGAQTSVSTFGNACQGGNLKLQTVGDNTTCDNNDAAAKFNNLIARIINAVSVVVGVVAVIMIIFGGFRYVTSGGESGNISNAKNTIMYAIIGLVIVVFAQFIVKFVLAKATGGTEASTVTG